MCLSGLRQSSCAEVRSFSESGRAKDDNANYRGHPFSCGADVGRGSDGAEDVVGECQSSYCGPRERGGSQGNPGPRVAGATEKFASGLQCDVQTQGPDPQLPATECAVPATG